MKARPIAALLFFCAAISFAVAQEQNADSQGTPQIPAAPAAFYQNLQYGFCFRAPWSYFIVDQTWSGTELDTQKAVSGPELVIRSRGWTPEDPWQDIPIMIFTPSQWKLVEAGKLPVGAPPTGPSELGRTSGYVFALPPRWIGFTDVEGQDAVEALMKRHPFQAPCEPIVYRNTQYGFCFRLPADWKGYQIVKERWRGGVPNREAPGTARIISGPLIQFRNPEWTQADPYQDIPIMVFTRAQWRTKEKEGIVVSAAGVDFGAIGRNANYVFAQPPRWFGYIEVAGLEEVGTWMSQNPLQAPCGTSQPHPRQP